MEGVKLTVTEEALVAIAKKAIKRKTGARGLRSIVEGVLTDVMYEVPSLGDVKEVVVDERVINESAKPTYIPLMTELLYLFDDSTECTASVLSCPADW